MTPKMSNIPAPESYADRRKARIDELAAASVIDPRIRTR